MTQPNVENDPGHDEVSLQRLIDELKPYSLDDLRVAMQYRLVDETSEGLTSKQAVDALALLMMLSSVLHGRGEVTDHQGHGNWYELHARSYPDDDADDTDDAQR